MSLAPCLEKLSRGETFSPADIDAAFAVIMNGEAAHEDIKRFLNFTLPSMADPAWIAGGARALRERMVRVNAPEGAIDVCGTGGDGAHTLNISTAVAFVVAGCGVAVAKHGNRAMSSKSGAADVLEALGVKLTGDTPTLERCLREAGVAFLFAQNHHPAMRHVALARRELGKRTIFNLLGPLSNPAGVKRQLVGVFSADFVEPMARALRDLKAERACVAHGAGGLDELSFAPGSNSYVMIDAPSSGELQVLQFTADIWPNCPAHGVEELRGSDARANAQALSALLGGGRERQAYRDTVLLNAAFALAVAGREEVWAKGWALAEESIDTGAARGALERLIEVSSSAP